MRRELSSGLGVYGLLSYVVRVFMSWLSAKDARFLSLSLSSVSFFCSDCKGLNVLPSAAYDGLCFCLPSRIAMHRT